MYFLDKRVNVICEELKKLKIKQKFDIVTRAGLLSLHTSLRREITSIRLTRRRTVRPGRRLTAGICTGTARTAITGLRRSTVCRRS